MMNRFQVVSANSEQVLNLPVSGKEPLRLGPDLKRRICRSCSRVRWYETSARLVSYRWVLCSTDGKTSR